MAFMQETIVAAGFKKQSALHTPLVAADMWNLGMTSADIPYPEMTFEDDAQDIGKGSSAVSQLFKLGLNAAFPWTNRLSSEMAAEIGVFGLGLDAKTVAGSGFKYSCKPTAAYTADDNMPVTTFAAAMRPGASAVFDRALIGCACNDFTLTLTKGIGRDTASIQTNWIGTGKYASPSTITIPAQLDTHELGIGQVITMTINGIDYVANQRLSEFTFSFNNNMNADDGYVPGSGSQDGFNLRGRMRRGRPSYTARMVVDQVYGSTEESLALAQTEGTATITLRGDAMGASYHQLTLTLHRIRFGAFKPMNVGDDRYGAEVQIAILEHNSNGILTWDAYCAQDDIGTAAV